MPLFTSSPSLTSLLRLYEQNNNNTQKNYGGHKNDPGDDDNDNNNNKNRPNVDDGISDDGNDKQKDNKNKDGMFEMVHRGVVDDDDDATTGISKKQERKQKMKKEKKKRIKRISTSQKRLVDYVTPVPDDRDYLDYLNFDEELSAILRIWYGLFEIAALIDFISSLLTMIVTDSSSSSGQHYGDSIGTTTKRLTYNTDVVSSSKKIKSNTNTKQYLQKDTIKLLGGILPLNQNVTRRKTEDIVISEQYLRWDNIVDWSAISWAFNPPSGVSTDNKSITTTSSSSSSSSSNSIPIEIPSSSSLDNLVQDFTVFVHENQFINYLQMHGMRWNILFSMMWFIQAIIVAVRRHKKIQQQKEQQRRVQRKRFVQRSIIKMQRSIAATSTISDTNSINTSVRTINKTTTSSDNNSNKSRSNDVPAIHTATDEIASNASLMPWIRYMMPTSKATTMSETVPSVSSDDGNDGYDDDDEDDDDDEEEEEKNFNNSLLKFGTDYFYISFFFVQLLMLPVGFYVYLYNFFFATILQHNKPANKRRRIIEETIQITHWSCHGDDVQKRGRRGGGGGGILSFFRRQQENQHIKHCREVYTTRTSISLSHAIVNNIAIAMSIRMRPIIQFFKSKGKNIVIRKARQILGRAIFHPIQYHSYYMKILRFIRWMNYLLPVLARLPMLKDNIVDLYKKYKQRRHAIMAQNLRKQYKRQLSKKSLEQYSATYVQKTFRAYMQRRHMAAAIQFHDQVRNDSAIRIQNGFRAALQRARGRIQLKQLQLQKLKEKELMQQTNSFDENDRYSVEALEYDIKKYLNDKLLLRPNTRFAIVWKGIVVTAMIAEIIFLLVLPPLLSRYNVHQQQQYKKLHPPQHHHHSQLSNHSHFYLYHSPDVQSPTNSDGSSKTFNIEAALRTLLVPVPVDELPQCQQHEESISIRRPIKSLQFIVKHVGKFVQNTISKSTSSTTRPKTILWYCTSKRYRTIQSLFIVMLDLMISNVVYLIGMLCYADIFVIFFTGTYNPKSGTLEPKPFVERWIVPGLLLQIATNPLMDTTYKYATFIFQKVVYFGPSRTMRWTLALLYPMAKLMSRVIKHVWKTIVKVENEQLVSSHSTNDLFSMTNISSALSVNNLPNLLGNVQQKQQQKQQQQPSMKSRPVYNDTNPLRLSCIRRSTTVGTNLAAPLSSSSSAQSMFLNRSPSLRYIHSKTKIFPGSNSTASLAKTLSSVRLPARSAGSGGSGDGMVLPKSLSTMALPKQHHNIRSASVGTNELSHLRYRHANYDSRPDLFCRGGIEEYNKQDKSVKPNLIQSFDSSSNFAYRDWSYSGDEMYNTSTSYQQYTEHRQQPLSSSLEIPVIPTHQLYHRRFEQITEQQESNLSIDD